MWTISRQYHTFCSSSRIFYLQNFEQMIVAIFISSVLFMFNSFFKKAEKQKEKEKVKHDQAKEFFEEKATLPANFAQNVMELEMQLEFVETYNMDLVKQLNEMYRIAIEYYINEDPRKANHFQKKLTSLLTNPYTLNLIEKEKKPASSKQSEIDVAQYSKHLKMELNKFNTQSDVVVRSMIEGSNKKIEKSNRMMSDNISSQEENLNRRLQQRSRSKKKIDTTPQ